MDAAHVVWALTLGVVVVLIVPLAIVLLHRTLRAARSIRRYLDEMLAAGAGIAGHTASIAALDTTVGTAGAMLGVAGDLKQHSGTIAAVLAARADRGSAE
jgi:hypothetical protein